MPVSYDTVIVGIGNNSGIEVPAAVLSELGAGKRPRVRATVDGRYSFSATVGSMNGLALLSFSKAHRDASGFGAGDQVTVVLEIDDAPELIEVPPELAAALAAHGLTDAFNGVSPSRRKEYARQVAEAKAAETRTRRVAKVIAELA
jgi:hypothetical protein